MIKTDFLFSLTAHVAPALEIGACPAGTRRIIPVLGGTFRGPRVSGVLLEGGSDLQLIRGDGVAELNIHAALKTDKGEHVLLRGMAVRAFRDAHCRPIPTASPLVRPPDSHMYFREAMVFETSAQTLSWMNCVMAIATGQRHEDRVELEVFEVM